MKVTHHAQLFATDPGIEPRNNRASLVAQTVKNPLAKQETWVQSLGWEDPLKKGVATTPVFWPGVPWTEKPSGL